MSQVIWIISIELALGEQLFAANFQEQARLILLVRASESDVVVVSAFGHRGGVVRNASVFWRWG